MIDTNSFLIPLEAKKALLVSDTQWGLEELDGLLKTMGGIAAETMIVQVGKGKINAATFLGSGKIDQIAEFLEAKDLDMVLFDFELSPTQFKNIEKVTKKLVLDRSGIILEIFNRHARTHESKLQVELARLQYLMPRLTHLWSHFERQRGSGGAALKGKGMGEKQIEVDRRLVKDRVIQLKRKLDDAAASRDVRRKQRESALKIALVGYTNAGKSTLLNALTHSEALVEDALFATLDAQVKLLNPKSRPIVLAIDTVGFIDRLPHTLVASFRSTLEEVLDADLLLHVLDASQAEVERQYQVTNQVLQELGAEKIPSLLVFNKTDKADALQLRRLKIWSAGQQRLADIPTPVYVSAYNVEDVNRLRETVLQYFDKMMETYELMIPFEDGKTSAQIFEFSRVEKKTETEKGMFFKIRTLPEFAARLNLQRYKI